ncbi:hypothetical protein F5884DRAFT_297224 [Xylogone sp. PMI_703]|nr:hypothetical protein F5884DRAFT_297224 [Xylogone sp. PMI_703]
MHYYSPCRYWTCTALVLLHSPIANPPPAAPLLWIHFFSSLAESISPEEEMCEGYIFWFVRLHLLNEALLLFFSFFSLPSFAVVRSALLSASPARPCWLSTTRYHSVTETSDDPDEQCPNAQAGFHLDRVTCHLEFCSLAHQQARLLVSMDEALRYTVRRVRLSSPRAT